MLDHPPSTPLLKLEPFIRALEYPGHFPAGPHEHISWPFVTLSRQTGAGGHLLAQECQKWMSLSRDPLFQGWQIFDTPTCMKLLEQAHLRIPYQSILDEEYHSEVEDLIYQVLTNRPPQQDVFRKVSNGIRALAYAGKVIIIGRAGVCATADMPRGIHIRLVANYTDRVERMMRGLQVTESQARQIIEERDTQRARLVRRHYSRSIDDPLLYDAVWNTSRDSLPVLARQLVQFIREKAPQEHFLS